MSTTSKLLIVYWHKTVLIWFQNSLPVRIKGILWYNEPPVFDILWTVLQPFIKEKTKNRVRCTTRHFLTWKEADAFDQILYSFSETDTTQIQYPTSNKVLVSGLCYLYYCLILYFLGIVELTNDYVAKCIVVFFHSAFGSVSGFHNTRLLSDPGPSSESRHLKWNRQSRHGYL